MSVRLERLIRIYNRLRRGPVTISVITQWAENADIKVSERQLYRDLNTLKTLQIAKGENVVEFIDEKNKKTWKLEYDVASEPLTQYDINSFSLFRNFVPGNIQEHRKESLQKFEAILYRSFSRNAYQKQTEAAELYLKKTNYWEVFYGKQEHKYLEDLIWALQNKRIIIILSDESNSSNIEPMAYSLPLRLMPIEMLFHQGQVYIAGVANLTTKLLIYRVDQPFEFELTNESFNRSKVLKSYKEQLDSRFGIAEPITDKVYHIKIEFAEGYGLAIKNNFLHHSAVWTELKNGNYLLKMQCCLTRELIGFLGFGLDKVKVHQPKALRDLVVKKFSDTIELYGGNEVNEETANKDY